MKLAIKKGAEEVFQKIDPTFLTSFIFFIVSTILDFSITTIGSGGDSSMEGNPIGRYWWNIAGALRFIEIPIWILVAFCLTSLVYSKNKFLGLLWLNILAFNHVLGFVTWLPYEADTVATILTQYTYRYPIGIISIILSTPISIVQILILKYSQRNEKPLRMG